MLTSTFRSDASIINSLEYAPLNLMVLSLSLCTYLSGTKLSQSLTSLPLSFSLFRSWPRGTRPDCSRRTDMNSPPLSQLTTSSRRPDTDKLPMHLSRVFSLSLYFNWHYLDRLTLRSSVSRRLFHLSQTILSQLVFLCRISSPFCLLCSRLLCQIIHCTAIQFLNSSPTLWLQSLS